jgi:hypothetical protein
VSSHEKHEDENQGIGLYTREQEKNTTPFQYFAQIVVSAVVFLCGVLFLVGIFDHRRQETIHFGNPESHLGGFVAAVAIIVVGTFMAHAGVIFWSRRVCIRPKKRSQRHHTAGQ